MRIFGSILQLAVTVLMIAAFAQAQKQMSDSEYTKAALSAAPKGVASGAAVARMESDGSMRTLRPGNNGFTCMIISTDKMCSDANSMEFMHAVMTHGTPPDKIGISYMLAGDDGASNTDPYATGKTADNHWVKTGPHIMIFGPGSKSLGLTEDKDPDPSKPYMMWAGTPYEHAMIPVGSGK